jgi:hypothetical protein
MTNIKICTQNTYPRITLRTKFIQAIPHPGIKFSALSQDRPRGMITEGIDYCIIKIFYMLHTL